MEGHKNYAGLKYKDWRKPRNKRFVDGYSPSTVQALHSLTCSKAVLVNLSESKGQTLWLYGTRPDIENEDLHVSPSK